MNTLTLLTALLLAPLSALPATAGPKQPNVILILTDDQGHGDVGCHGNPTLKTPNIDKFFGESVRYTDFHVSPNCTPTRAALMTGCDPVRVGAWSTAFGHSMLREGVPTMADAFAGSGYRTALFGKWHLGDNYPFRPEDRGCLTFGASMRRYRSCAGDQKMLGSTSVIPLIPTARMWMAREPGSIGSAVPSKKRACPGCFCLRANHPPAHS